MSRVVKTSWICERGLVWTSDSWWKRDMCSGTWCECLWSWFLLVCRNISSDELQRNASVSFLIKRKTIQKPTQQLDPKVRNMNIITVIWETQSNKKSNCNLKRWDNIKVGQGSLMRWGNMRRSETVAGSDQIMWQKARWNQRKMTKKQEWCLDESQSFKYQEV